MSRASPHKDNNLSIELHIALHVLQNSRNGKDLNVSEFMFLSLLNS